MCEALNTHWGYAEQDFDYKSPADMIRALAGCRRYGANFLLNIGPMGNGLVRPLDGCYLDLIGDWVKLFEEAIRLPPRSVILIRLHFLIK